MCRQHALPAAQRDAFDSVVSRLRAYTDFLKKDEARDCSHFVALEGESSEAGVGTSIIVKLLVDARFKPKVQFLSPTTAHCQWNGFEWNTWPDESFIETGAPRLDRLSSDMEGIKFQTSDDVGLEASKLFGHTWHLRSVDASWLDGPNLLRLRVNDAGERFSPPAKKAGAAEVVVPGTGINFLASVDPWTQASNPKAVFEDIATIDAPGSEASDELFDGLDRDDPTVLSSRM